MVRRKDNVVMTYFSVYLRLMTSVDRCSLPTAIHKKCRTDKLGQVFHPPSTSQTVGNHLCSAVAASSGLVKHCKRHISVVPHRENYRGGHDSKKCAKIISAIYHRDLAEMGGITRFDLCRYFG